MNEKVDGLVRWSLSLLPSISRQSYITSPLVSRTLCEIIDFDGCAGPRLLQHVCIKEYYGSAQDGRQRSSKEGITKSYRKEKLLLLLSRKFSCGTKCRINHLVGRNKLWIGALKHHRYRCVVRWPSKMGRR